ncbi:MAG: SPOR domain-containing protein [Pseudotabrizicola sp.]|uniref:SPOR domain-containing protein n=1 Tax=Pseudotabrizicola sp. TaxID=2939647 RepID=UPI00271F1626|nr:SPOR domain-containing protein [Pseudotabrizicola sp.]MDO9640198.1 SPOR domain-containing protein [Pseudotabrizicola sp.]
MVLRWVPAAVLAVVAGLSVANAQSAGDFGGPRELPPASFSGQQYVDSRGCVFLRAGLSGRTNWVPRVSSNRAPLCGYPPTFGNNQVAIVEPAPSANPAPDAAASAAPVRTQQAPRVVAPAGTVPAPAVPAARIVQQPRPEPQRQIAERVATTGTRGTIGCYTTAPVAERFRLRNGGSIVLCTRGDGDIAHARAPRVLAGVAAIAPSGYLEGPDPAAHVGQRQVQRTTAAAEPQVIPKGYRAAFTDDRLNPNRAKGTQQGWAQQDQIWTREVPARLVADVAKEQGKPVATPKVYASTKSEPAASGRSFVQVGTFGEASNADGASSRLAGLGLPVARSRISSKGKPMQIVFAGPFGSRAEAQAALNAARRAGFGDAFIR